VSRGKALVLKTYSNGILVLTAQGEFRRLKKHPPLPQPGEEIDLQPASRARWLPLALAAVLMLAAILPLRALALRPAAYIALDINPSLGLTVGRSGTVKSAEGLNADGARLLKEVQVVGKPPAVAVEALVRQAALDGYLADRPEDLVVVTRVDLDGGSAVPLGDLEAAVRRALEKTGRDAFVAVEEAQPSELMEARNGNISLNKLRLLKKLTPGTSQKQLQQEDVVKNRDEGIKEILARAGKRADEVYPAGRWEGKNNKSQKPGGPEVREGAGKKPGEPKHPAQSEPAGEHSAQPKPGGKPAGEQSAQPKPGKPAEEHSAQPKPGKKIALPAGEAKVEPTERILPRRPEPALTEGPVSAPGVREESSSAEKDGEERETGGGADNKQVPDKASPGAGSKKKEPSDASGSTGGKKKSSTPRAKDRADKES